MQQTDNADVAVVEIDYRREVAYNMGHREFAELDTAEDTEIDPQYITDSARWANVIAPDLRAMAGYADSGPGTYTEDRQVAAIIPGCEDDNPADADLLNASFVYAELNDAYFRGAYDAVDAE
jgi:hypothetical protein